MGAYNRAPATIAALIVFAKCGLLNIFFSLPFTATAQRQPTFVSAAMCLRSWSISKMVNAMALATVCHQHPFKRSSMANKDFAKLWNNSMSIWRI